MNLPDEDAARAGANASPKAVAQTASLFGLELLDDAGIVEARALAARLIGEAIAPASSFIAVQQIFAGAVFGLRESGALTGVLAAFPLNQAGHEALTSGGFDAAVLDPLQVALPGHEPAAYYGWGFAASTKDGARAVMKASVEIHRQLYWAVPVYARAVTGDGERALQSIGFRPMPGREGLLAIAPQTQGLGR